MRFMGRGWYNCSDGSLPSRRERANLSARTSSARRRLTRRDYYRLAAIFKGAYDENDWLRPSKAANEFPLRGLKHVLPGEKELWEAGGVGVDSGD